MGCLKLQYHVRENLSYPKAHAGGRAFFWESAQVWLSVDPMAGKYPSHSPYNYCLNNPIKLVDPNGMEVEYNSFSDRIITGLARIFDGGFRKQFKELKKSEETYVFNGKKKSDSGAGNLSTDGDKLYINYNRGRNAKQGTNTFTNLRHESEHGVQFEHGELGFEFKAGTWSATNTDIGDELGAREAGYTGTVLSSDPKKNMRNSWLYGGATRESKIESLRESGYNADKWPDETRNNTNTTKIKTSTEYKMPHRKRN